MTSLIIRQGTRWVVHTIALISVYLLFAGHNAPGGGFVGGLVAGAAVVLVYVAYGCDELLRIVRVAPEALLGTGVLLAGGVGVGAVVAGGRFLESGEWQAVLPVLGEVTATSVLMFDAGVYLVVVGLVLAVLDSLGREMGDR